MKGPGGFHKALVLILTIQIAFVLSLPRMSLPASEAEASRGLNLAVLVEGTVSFKEKGWTNYAPVVFGMALQLGDLLRLEDTAHAKIICSDLTLHDLQPGLVGIPCAGTRDLLRSSEGSLINATRNWSNDGSYPLVLSPRKTKLLSRNPILRWNAVPGAKSYRISSEFLAREEQVRHENIVLERQLGQELAKPGPEMNPYKIATLESRLVAVRASYQALLSQVKLSNATYAPLLSVRPITLAEAQQRIDSDTTIVSYFTTPDTTFAFVITKNSFRLTKLHVSADGLYRDIAVFRDFSGENGVSPSLRNLYKSLIGPLR
jgi:hypothetical protein